MTKITVESSIQIDAPRPNVFRYVADWENAPRYVPHIYELALVGPVKYGEGTRLKGRARFGSALLRPLTIETVSEVVTFQCCEKIICRSLQGIENSNTWLFHGEGARTTVSAIVTYRLPGRTPGEIVARLLAREISTILTTALENLKRILEGQKGGEGDGKEGLAQSRT